MASGWLRSKGANERRFGLVLGLAIALSVMAIVAIQIQIHQGRLGPSRIAATIIPKGSQVVVSSRPYRGVSSSSSRRCKNMNPSQQIDGDALSRTYIAAASGIVAANGMEESGVQSRLEAMEKKIAQLESENYELRAQLSATAPTNSDHDQHQRMDPLHSTRHPPVQTPDEHLEDSSESVNQVVYDEQRAFAAAATEIQQAAASSTPSTPPPSSSLSSPAAAAAAGLTRPSITFFNVFFSIVEAPQREERDEA